jgi:hypothetical protein
VPGITLLVVHGILAESNTTNFFGGNRLVCTLVNTDPESLVVSNGHISNVLLLNMRCVRDKVPLSDIDACKALNVNTDQLRSIHHSAESNFITWYKDGSPDITTENLRDVTRMTDARGKQFFEEFDVPLVDLTAADEKTRKKESTKSISKDKGKKKSIGQRTRPSGSAAKLSRSKTAQESTSPDPSHEFEFLEKELDETTSFPESKYNPYPQSLHRAPRQGPQMISPSSVKVRERAAAAEATVVEKDKQLGMWQAFAAERFRSGSKIKCSNPSSNSYPSTNSISQLEEAAVLVRFRPLQVCASKACFVYT